MKLISDVVKLIVGFCVVLAVAHAQVLPPIFQGVQESLLKSEVVVELPKNTFLENLYFDQSSAKLYVTSHEDGVIYLLQDKQLVRFATVPGKAAGIAGANDGSFLVTGSDKAGKAAIFHLEKDGKVKQTFAVPNGLFLNGISQLSEKKYLIADSYKGVVWQLDLQTASVSQWLADPLLERADASSPFPAANGIRIQQNRVLISNTAKQLLISVPLQSNKGPGKPEVVASGVNIDDFAMDAEGSLFAATHVYNSVVKIDKSGKKTIVSGALQGMVGSTSVILGPQLNGKKTLYVTTNGGMFLPPPEGVQQAKLVRIYLN
ncbi:MAG: SMP-30/gluconolactonase/LRE family protein [Burkholderiaceae bacterium]